MKKKFTTLFGILMVPSLLLFAEAPAEKAKEPVEVKKSHDIEKVSKSLGHLIANNLSSLDLGCDLKEVVKGIQEFVAGTPSPLSEAECMEAVASLQRDTFQKRSDENLALAEAFLHKNKGETGVVEIEANKVQYVCLQKGTGSAVEEHFSPIIRYTGKFLDGKVFSESTSGEVVSLDETIPGFRKAILGMKEGEKRRVFIHPELGYGTSGFLPPNSLLTFDIEVVTSNAPKTEDISLSSAPFEDHLDEVAEKSTLR